jgi:dienelactone hydrolase
MLGFFDKEAFALAAKTALLAFLASLPLSVRSADPASHEEIYYPSGKLRIQAYLYKPEGVGPFPAVIYNHGTRDGRERESFTFPHIGRMLTRAGYAVLVPERRGYGKSDGKLWWQEGAEGPALIARLQAETDDVLAAVEYLRRLQYVDAGRLGIMGWSFGGVVTMMAASRSKAFLVAVDQAGGALSWDGSSAMQGALISAAKTSSTPTLFMVAKNDRTTASVTTLASIFAKRGVPHRLIVYEEFTPPRRGAAAPGHALFSAQGASLWEKDVLEFVDRRLR